MSAVIFSSSAVGQTDDSISSQQILSRGVDLTPLKPVGYCLIVDNSSISKQSRSFPIKRLCHILKEQYHFVTLYFSSLSLNAIELLLSTLSQLDQSNSSCLVVIMIDASNQDIVNGTDSRGLPTKNVMEYFTDEKCPGLVDKPKIFLFQSVSTDQKDDKIKLTCTQPDSTATEYRQLSSLMETLHAYNDSATIGSIFVNSSQTNLANPQLKQAFVLPVHSTDTLRRELLLTELGALLKVFLPIREVLIRMFTESESLIIKTCHDIYTNKLVAGTGGVAGTIFTVTGLALIPVTLGISLIMTGVGAGIGAAGGITALVSTVTDSISKNELKNLKCLAEMDSQICQCINSLWQRSSSLSVNEKKLLDQLVQNSRRVSPSDTEGLDGNLVEPMDLIEVVTKAYKQLNNKELSAIALLKNFVDQKQQEFEDTKNFNDALSNIN